MNCKDFKNNINLFFNDKLKKNVLRQFIYHIEDCKEYYNVLYDEYVFFVVLNDLDLKEKFDYKKSINDKIEDLRQQIISNDKYIVKKYIYLSLLFYFIIIVLAIILIRIIY